MVTLPLPRLRSSSSSVRRYDWIQDQCDWTTSKLGAFAKWPAELRQVVLLSMADTSPSAVLWGPVTQTTIVYNEPFALLLGNRHPSLQGQLIRNELADLCADFERIWQRQVLSGVTETIRNQRIRQDRLGFVEERTYNWKFIPIFGEDGSVAGSLITVQDESDRTSKRERSKTAAKEFSVALKDIIDKTAQQTLRLEEHFSGKSCDCGRLWEAMKQLELHEQRYEKFADYAPVGIGALDKDYQLEWANKAYFDVMAQPHDSKASFLDYVHPDDVSLAQGYFDTGAFRDGAYTFECRLKKGAARPAISSSSSETPRPLEPSPAWVLVSAFRENGSDQSTMCWIIDITSHKTAEEFLRKRMDEAVLDRKQKEKFIDMISHEVRNPLSAMVHCTDDIIDRVRQWPGEGAQDIIEAAQTIGYCTQHIKAIVGDVLTLSKLDSRLVEIVPKPTNPRELIQEALKIFKTELRVGGIEMKFETDASMTDLDIDWLMMDPGRCLQVLLNFVTNAIKVIGGVQEPSRREIVVTLSATTEAEFRPSESVRCVMPRQECKPIDFGEPYNQTKSVYLAISVEDSGPGLGKEDLDSLFERFAQANPKTESKYGGLGLGLFISRDLTELQGGRIGVASSLGVGSKFVYSIESKRALVPNTLQRIVTIEIPTRLLGSSTADSPGVATTLPVVPPPGSGVAVPVEVITPPAEQPANPDKPNPLRILVVEDNVINQRVLANQLRKRGFEVDVALHGEEALEKLCMSNAASRSAPVSKPSSDSISTIPAVRRKPVPPPPVVLPYYDIVLMDIEMPIMDGITCAQQIRGFEADRGRGGKIPIIAVTANARNEHGCAALEAGMNAITTKPYKIATLLEQIEEFCGPQT